jgi:stearoyl-CoA desaturase (Delta-9 desaturase)
MLQETLKRAQRDAAEVLTEFHLPHMPTREQFLAEAKAIFVKTPSLDEIVDRAYALLSTAVGARVAAAISVPS